jgi:PAS domain S-box-containing protein
LPDGGLVALHRDVTEQVRESEAHYRALAELSPDGIMVHADGIIGFANRAQAKILGLESPEILIGQDAIAFVPEEDRDNVMQRRQQAGGDEALGYREATYVRADGSVVEVERAIAKVTWRGMPSFLVVTRDITQQNRAARALAKSERRFRDFAEASADWFWETDANLRFTYMSANVERITGVKPEWHYGKTREDFLGDDYDRETWDAHLETLRRHEPFREFVYCRAGEGIEPRWLSSSGTPVFDQDGNFQGYRGSASDVTARVEAERAVQANEAQLRLVTDNLPALIVYFDREMRYRFVNKICEQWYARPHDDIVGASVEEVLGHGTTKTIQPRLSTAMDGNAVTFEDRVTYPDGVARDVQISYIPNIDPHGDVVGCFALILDITERKAADLELRTSESRFRAFIDNSPSAILLKHTDGRYLTANRRWHDWFNPEGREIVGKTVFDFYPESHAAEVTEMDRRVLSGGPPVEAEIRTPFADGTERTTLYHKFPIVLEDGTVIGIGGINTDITERKQAEEALRRSEARLTDAIESISEGFVYYDSEKRLVHCNKKYREYYPWIEDVLVPGASLDDITRTAAERGQAAGDFDDAEGWIRDRLKTYRSDHDREERQLRDGRWVLCTQNSTSDGGIVGIRTDITERKEAERSRQESHELLQSLMDSLPAFISVKNPGGDYLYVNRVFEDWYATSRDVALGKQLDEFMPEGAASSHTPGWTGVAVRRPPRPRSAPWHPVAEDSVGSCWSRCEGSRRPPRRSAAPCSRRWRRGRNSRPRPWSALRRAWA